MKALDMETITASLERSFRNFSLNQSSGSPAGEDAGIGISASNDDSPENHSSLDDATLQLNSHISLPYHWEQCLDLKTGQIYYINWRSGMSAKERPPAMAELYSSEDDSSYDSEGSSSSEPAPESESKSGNQQHNEQQERQVLVVAGCKRCLMYLMVPKQLGDCPKCCGRLLHFDPSQDVSPSP